MTDPEYWYATKLERLLQQAIPDYRIPPEKGSRKDRKIQDKLNEVLIYLNQSNRPTPFLRELQAECKAAVALGELEKLMRDMEREEAQEAEAERIREEYRYWLRPGELEGYERALDQYAMRRKVVKRRIVARTVHSDAKRMEAHAAFEQHRDEAKPVDEGEEQQWVMRSRKAVRRGIFRRRN